MGGWIHYLDECGGVDGAVAKMRALGCDTAILKAWDGDGFGDSKDPDVFRRQFQSACAAFKAKGFKVLAWGYVYGGPVNGWTSITPEREAAALMAACAGADGVILDAEYEYVNRIDEARRFFGALQVDVPLAFAPDFRILVGNAYSVQWNAGGVNLTAEPWPWDEFLARCQAVMPQFYFTDFQVSPQATFGLVDTYKAACQQQGWPEREVLPILPTNATSTDLDAARQCVTERGLPGHSYWLLG